MQELREWQVEGLKARHGITKWLVIAGLTIIGLVILSLIGCPSYNVYSARKDGEAQLAHAQSSKEVAVAEAKAKMESATMLAAADTIRAHGIAVSNQIIGNSLKNNESYLHWLWIDNLKDNKNTIYIATENGIPKFNIPLIKEQTENK